MKHEEHKNSSCKQTVTFIILCFLVVEGYTQPFSNIDKSLKKNGKLKLFKPNLNTA